MKHIDLSTVDSTNEYAKRNIEKVSHLTIITTSYQTAGKGRNGHTWESNEGENLLASIVLKQEMKIEDIQQLTQVTAVAIVQYLKNRNIVATIKWPNDIYVKDNKIAGILIESIYTNKVEGIIIGVGLNANSQDQYTSMKKETGNTYCIKEEIKEFMEQFLNYYNYYIQGNYDAILKEANALSYLKDKWIDYQGYGRLCFVELLSSGQICAIDMNEQKHYLWINEISLSKEKD